MVWFDISSTIVRTSKLYFERTQMLRSVHHAWCTCKKTIFDAMYVHMYMQRHIIHTHVTCIHKTKVDIIYDQIHSKIIEFDVSMQIIPDLTKHKTIYCTVSQFSIMSTIIFYVGISYPHHSHSGIWLAINASVSE